MDIDDIKRNWVGLNPPPEVVRWGEAAEQARNRDGNASIPMPPAEFVDWLGLNPPIQVEQWKKDLSEAQKRGEDGNAIAPPPELYTWLRHVDEIMRKQAQFEKALIESNRSVDIFFCDMARLYQAKCGEPVEAGANDLTQWAPLFRGFAKYGWYPNMSMLMTELTAMTKALVDGDTNELNKLFSDSIRDSLDYHMAKVIELFPERKAIFEQALLAHKQGLYYLSITALLTQIDALPKESTNFSFFEKYGKDRQWLPKLGDWARRSRGVVVENAFLSALLVNGAFQKHRDVPNELNFSRHSILHGETTDYGTEINSLRTFSLLIFLSQVCSREFIEAGEDISGKEGTAM